jgi:hypothetical protein
MSQKLQLGSIDLGGGVTAVSVWLTDGPIVLISTRNQNGAERNSRLDLQKGMFIDPLPGDPTADGVTRVVRGVRAAAAVPR